MKNPFKRILPILLVIVIIISIGWYLLVYDREFTRDLLLYQARLLEEEGNHSTAAWFYDLAYRQSGNNEEVAIELAEQFKSIGNYTKAEVTLSNAIADGGSVELYIALCKTYVEQDKLLDAVTMLENVSDPQIREQLKTLRPAAPTASVAPGFYSQYMTVSFACKAGDLYLTTDSRYPTTADQPHDGNITLAAGENTILALALNEQGLVSPLAVFGYTIGGVIEEVTFADASVDELVRLQLGLDSDDKIYSNDLWGITAFAIPQDVTDYSFLSNLPNLTTLIINSGNYTDLKALANLTSLHTLSIRDSFVTAEDLKVIASLPRLENLTLSNCQLSSIENLSDAKNLQTLDLSNNAIGNLKPLAFMTGLKQLNLSHNALVSLNGLSPLKALESLNISYNSVSSIVPLAACTALQELDISFNSLTKIGSLENMPDLNYLNAEGNQIADVSVLGSCTNLTVLDISGNVTADISALGTLKKLIDFDFSYNMVPVLPDFGTDCALVYINGTGNQLLSISSLAGYEHLNKIIMDHNNITEVNVLASCPQLVQVSVFGNPVKDVSELTYQSITVFYDPT